MARFTEDLSGGGGVETAESPLILTAGNGTVQLPEGGPIADAELIREGNDLILRAEDGTEVVVEGYFLASPQPMIFAPDGTGLSPDMVQSFLQHDGPLQYAQNATMSDTSPIGFIQEASGEATVTRTDGSTETITVGTPVFQGDIVETNAEGAVNITFIDESSFAVSNNARLAIDEYIYDPATDSGTSNFSMLRGMFIYTSGLIGREDPDDVEIDTPMGSIGIRGTVIAGDVDSGEITVVEGAIVLKSFNGEELTLATQFETGKFMPQTGELVLMGTSDSGELGAKFSSINPVAPDFFSGLQSDSHNGDTAADSPASGDDTTGETQSGEPATSEESSAGTTDGASTTTSTAGTTSETNETAGTGEGSTSEATTADTSLSTTDSSATSFDGGGSSFDSSSGETTTTSTSSTTGGTTTTTTTTTSTSTGGSTGSGTTSGETTTTTAPPPTGGTGTPVNGAPTVNSSATSIGENAATGASVHTVVASDPEGDTLTYSITGGNTGNTFAINASTGEITLNNPLDYETTTSYNLTVSASDGTNTSSNSVVVNVSDVNEYSVGGITDSDAATNSISEAAASGATVGITAYAQDLDGSNNTITYSLTAGNNGGGRFEIDATSGVVTYNGGGVLDFESFSSHNIQVKATSSDGSFNTMSYTISVDDVNEAPTVTADTVGISENTATGTSVHTVVASDPEGAALTYSITGGNTGNAFAINASTGEITLANPLDYETTTSYNLTVSAFDGTNTSSDTVTVNVTDFNEAPTVSAATIPVSEGATIGSSIHTVSASDPEGAALTYSITGGNGGGEFAIDSNTGEITLANPLDYETTTSYNLTVSAFDGTNTTTNTVTVNVGNVDDTAPTGIDVSFSINEDVGAVIDLFALVSDVDTTLTKADISVSGATNGTVSYNSTTGQATFNPTTDFNGNGSFTYTVTDGVRTATNTVTLTYTPVNDAPVLSGPPVDMNVNEDDTSPLGDTVSTILNSTFSDVDGDPAGMAITTVDTTNGSWEYSVDGGTNWTAITGVSETSALLLEGTHLIRFVPNANYDGTASLNYKAWDQTSGTAGGTADTTTGSAFSSTSETATVTVLPDGDFENSGTYTLTTGADTVTVSGTSISLYGDAGADTITVSGSNTHIEGQQDNDTITVTGAGASDNAIYGGIGNDILTLDSGIGSNNTIYGGDGDDQIIIRTNDYLAHGGLSVTGDTLIFDAAGSYNIDNIRVKNIETIDSADGTVQTLNFKINQFLLANDTSNDDLVINIGVGDTANFDFTTWDGAGTFALQSGSPADDTQPTVFYNGATNQTITVNRLTGSVINETGLSPSLNNIDSAKGFWIKDTAGMGFGSDIAAISDSSNGTKDGYDDLLITNQLGDEVTTLLGGTGLANMAAPTGVSAKFTGSVTDISSISSIGDFNGDGITDFIVGAEAADTTNQGSGQAHIVDLNGNVLVELDGFNSPDLVGRSVTGIGDINGDGYADVLIGAPMLDTDLDNDTFYVTNDGQAYVLFGDSYNAGTTTTLDVTALAPTDGIVIEGNNVSDRFGNTVSSLGDFNNDGYADFAISAPDAGTVQIHYGGNDSANQFMTISGISTTTDIPLMDMGDFNGDGITDLGVYNKSSDSLHIFYGNELYNGASADLTLSNSNFTISTNPAHEIVSGGSIGDFNGDGIDDVAVVLQGTDGTNLQHNVDIYVVYGRAGNSTLTLDGTNVADTFHITYQIPAGIDLSLNSFDIEVSAAGDINGDGFYDLAIGMPQTDNDADGLYDDGSVGIIYGHDESGTVLTDLNDGSADGVITATAANQSLVGDSTFTDSNTFNDGNLAGINISAGGGVNDTINLSRSDFGVIDGGAGRDTLNYSGDVLDFSDLNSEQVQRVEELAFNNSGSSQYLILSDEVMNNLMATSDGHDLAILGDATPDDVVLIQKSGSIPQAFMAGEEALFAASIGASYDAVNNEFDIGATSLKIDTSFFSGNLIVGDNFVLDNDGNDADVSVGNMAASLDSQTLVGSQGIDTFSDGGLVGGAPSAVIDTSMFGLGGNDTFQISNGNFNVLDGGSGSDTLQLIDVNGSLDLSNFSADEIKNIENILLDDGDTLNDAAGQTLTLTLDNILNMAGTSETNRLTIMSNGDLQNNLIINDGDANAENIINQGLASITAELDDADGGAIGSVTHDGANTITFANGVELFISTDLLTNGVDII